MANAKLAEHFRPVICKCMQQQHTGISSLINEQVGPSAWNGLPQSLHLGSL